MLSPRRRHRTKTTDLADAARAHDSVPPLPLPNDVSTTPSVASSGVKPKRRIPVFLGFGRRSSVMKEVDTDAAVSLPSPAVSKRQSRGPTSMESARANRSRSPSLTQLPNPAITNHFPSGTTLPPLTISPPSLSSPLARFRSPAASPTVPSPTKTQSHLLPNPNEKELQASPSKKLLRTPSFTREKRLPKPVITLSFTPPESREEEDRVFLSPRTPPLPVEPSRPSNESGRTPSRAGEGSRTLSPIGETGHVSKASGMPRSPSKMALSMKRKSIILESPAKRGVPPAEGSPTPPTSPRIFFPNPPSNTRRSSTLPKGLGFGYVSASESEDSSSASASSASKVSYENTKEDDTRTIKGEQPPSPPPKETAAIAGPSAYSPRRQSSRHISIQSTTTLELEAILDFRPGGSEPSTPSYLSPEFLSASPLTSRSTPKSSPTQGDSLMPTPPSIRRTSLRPPHPLSQEESSIAKGKRISPDAARLVPPSPTIRQASSVPTITLSKATGVRFQSPGSPSVRPSLRVRTMSNSPPISAPPSSPLPAAPPTSESPLIAKSTSSGSVSSRTTSISSRSASTSSRTLAEVSDSCSSRTLASSVPSIPTSISSVSSQVFMSPSSPLVLILRPCTLQHPHDALNGVHFLAEAVAQQRQGIQGALAFRQRDVDGLANAPRYHIVPQGYQGDFAGHAVSESAPFDRRVVTEQEIHSDSLDSPISPSSEQQHQRSPSSPTPSTNLRDALERTATLETENAELKGRIEKLERAAPVV
ncbi:hypothetical protein EW146_g2676 [Bondarzewia mesenterica]|uniref:Uncharacterized protein n=1 Tax=Bondarzewia mesenterica TaxID=1095465 RepID=A0A4S4M1C6_9AGAM|nr:hypothetical protein EW146_g2676 [Bondarzewia mesenterica]